MSLERDIEAEMRDLSREIEKGIARALHPRTPKLAPLPDDLTYLFCDVCGNFTSSNGCPDHPRQEKLL